MKTGDILFKTICICLIPIVLAGSIITIIGGLVKVFGYVISLQIDEAKDELYPIKKAFFKSIKR